MQVLSLTVVNNVYNELKKSSSHLLDNLSNCLTCAPENFPTSARSFLQFISLNCTSQTFLSMSTMMLMIRIMFTVGNGDRYVDRYIGRRSGRHSIDTRSTLGRHSIDTRSPVDRHSVDCPSTLGRHLVDSRSIFSR